MKKFFIFATVLAVLVFGSCKSTKQEEPVDDSQNTVVDNSQTEDSTLEQEEVQEEVETQDNDEELRRQALEKIAAAKELKAIIEQNNFQDNDKDSYLTAESLLPVFDKAVESGSSGKELLPLARDAYDKYYAVYYKSFKKLADKERVLALEQKKNADNVKAGVARKDEYKAITEIFKSGDSSYVTKNPEGAYNKYKESKEKFGALATDVGEKRAEAQKRIDEAKAKVLEAENFANTADQESPLGDEKLDGIEEQGTVLLESDNFENPEDSVIQIEENVDSSIYDDLEGDER